MKPRRAKALSYDRSGLRERGTQDAYAQYDSGVGSEHAIGKLNGSRIWAHPIGDEGGWQSGAKALLIWEIARPWIMESTLKLVSLSQHTATTLTWWRERRWIKLGTWYRGQVGRKRAENELRALENTDRWGAGSVLRRINRPGKRVTWVEQIQDVAGKDPDY